MIFTGEKDQFLQLKFKGKKVIKQTKLDSVAYVGDHLTNSFWKSLLLLWMKQQNDFVLLYFLFTYLTVVNHPLPPYFTKTHKQKVKHIDWINNTES